MAKAPLEPPPLPDESPEGLSLLLEQPAVSNAPMIAKEAVRVRLFLFTMNSRVN
ncbi:MAG: hypothetical protein LBC97_03925 [Bifidobacteriaceae bacterium]|nr:hypothetical protein [Bifidobacteriaceae bacterium]